MLNKFVIYSLYDMIKGSKEACGLKDLISSNISISSECLKRLESQRVVILCEGENVIGGVTYRFYFNGESGFDRQENHNYVVHDFGYYSQIEFLVVDEAHRGRGLAKELLVCAENEIEISGVKEIVTSRVFNNKVNFLLKKLGYEKKKYSDRYKKILK